MACLRLFLFLEYNYIMLQIVIVAVIFIYTLVVFFVISSAFFTFMRTRVPFVPSKEEDIEDMIDLAQIRSGDRFLDIGSGDGKVVFFVHRVKDVEATGIESGLWMHWFAKLKRFFTRANKTDFVRGDFFKHDWSGFDVIYAYLYPPLMATVEEKFFTEGKQGARLVVKDFYLPGRKAEQEVNIDSRHTLYLYEI